MALLDRFRVQPAEQRKFTIDYSQRLTGTLLLSTVQSVSVDNETTPPFEIAAAVTLGQTGVVLYTSGGLDGQEYKMEILVQTSDDGQVWEDEVIFTVEDT